MDDRRPTIQHELAFETTGRGNVPGGRGGTESPMAGRDTESLASTERLMEEVCERENLAYFASLGLPTLAARRVN